MDNYDEESLVKIVDASRISYLGTTLICVYGYDKSDTPPAWASPEYLRNATYVCVGVYEDLPEELKARVVERIKSLGLNRTFLISELVTYYKKLVTPEEIRNFYAEVLTELCAVSDDLVLVDSQI